MSTQLCSQAEPPLKRYLCRLREEITAVIVIFYAFGREASALRRKVESRAALEVPGLTGFRGKLGAAEVAAIATGIGTERAREAARRAFDSLPPVDFAISTGVVHQIRQHLPHHVKLFGSSGKGSKVRGTVFAPYHPDAAMS